jgi:F420-dependent methylenetetrahydromethanopterin dehydrogenase
LKVIIKSGIKEIIIGDRPHVVAEGYLEHQSLLYVMHGITMRKFIGKLAFLDGREIKE